MIMFLMVTVFIVAFQAINAITLPYKDVPTCSESEFFQYSSLQCVPCGSNKKRSIDALSCICDSGFKLTKNNGGPEIKCRKCDEKEAVTLDGWNCVKCVNDSFDDDTKTCKACRKGIVSVDRFENGSFYPDHRQTCLTCVKDTRAYSFNRICRRCDQRVLELTSSSPQGSSCTCPESIKKDGDVLRSEESDGICFLSKDLIVADVPYSYTIKITSFQTIESAFFRQHFRAAQAMCSIHQNFTSCQLLGNLCVMYMYNQDNFESSGGSRTDACKEYLSLVLHNKKEVVENLPDWPSTMPWLYYRVETSLVTLDKTDIHHKFERREILKFVIISYHANGTFISISEDATILQMCTRSQYISAQAYRFSTPYRAECKLSLNNLWKKWETIFFDLYLLLDNKLYPVPVLVDNIENSGVYVNRESDRSYWRLTRRFFLVDNLSGRSKSYEGPSIIQYAENLEIFIRLRGDGLIYPPLLKVKYAVADISNILLSDKVSVSFQMSYEMDTDKIHQNIQIATGVLSMFALVYATIRIFSYRKRQGVQVIDCTSILIFFMYTFGALTFVFIMLLIGTCIQWLFFFKHQTSVIRVLPTTDQEKIIKTLFVAAFIMKAINVMFILYTQIDVDIFFIDWERPHAPSNVSSDEQGKPTSVSIMRTLFVANEWRELQTTRKIKPVLLILILLFFLKVVGFENWTTTDPLNRLTVDPTIDYIGETHFTLRIAVICLLYVIITVILWILFSFIYERFVGDLIGDFIDFCSMSNISVFILSHMQFGYYIHGLSVHGRADTNLHELYEQFQREEDNLCGTRGLEPNTDRQTFEVAITTKFRNDYDKILQLMINRDIQVARREQLPIKQNQGSSLPASLESSVNAYNMMNRYLSSFIEHSIRDNNYVVKDKVFTEKVLQNEIYAPIEQCALYNDDNRSFTSILLYGQEWSLLIFNLLLFIMVDWLSNWNAVLASVVAYFFDISLITLRDYFGKRNLAIKTMVDERFLI